MEISLARQPSLSYSCRVAELNELKLPELIDYLRANIARNRRIEREAGQAADRDERALNALEPLLGNDPAQGQMPLSAPPEGDASLNGDSPRGERAVALVMRERRDGFWTSAEIHAALEERGWISASAKHPKAGTEAALSRLARKGLVSRNGGVYQYMAPPDEVLKN